MDPTQAQTEKPEKKKKKKSFIEKVTKTIKSIVEDVKNLNFTVGDKEVSLDFENTSYQFRKTKTPDTSGSGQKSDDHKV